MTLKVFGCPACQQPFQVAKEQSGQIVQCPSCAQPVEIPASAFAETEPPPAQQEAYSCPNCSGKFGITPSMFGHHVGCPHCQTSVLVQSPTAQSETAASPVIHIDVANDQNLKSGKRWKSPAKKPETPDLFAPGFENPETSPAEPEKPIKPVRRKTKEQPPQKREPTESQAAKPATSSESKNDRSKQTDSPPQKKKPTSDLVPPQRKRAEKIKSKPPNPGGVSPPVHVDLSPPKSSDPPNSSKPPGADPAAARAVEPEIVESEIVESESVASEVVDDKVVDAASNDRIDEQSDSAVKEPAGVEPVHRPDPIDHLLPPRFNVLDPTRMRFSSGKDQFKVLLPDGKGGTQQIDQRVVRVEHEGEQVSLVTMTEKEKHRRRLIQNIVAIVIGIIIMAIAFLLLR